MLRDIENLLADAIREDERFREAGVECVVEDNGDMESQISQGLATSGIVVMVAVTGFNRRTQSGPVVTGTVDVEMRVIESPTMNRADDAHMTAQQVAERLTRVFHWSQVPGVNGPLRFKGFFRDDVQEMNIVRTNWEGETSVGVFGAPV